MLLPLGFLCYVRYCEEEYSILIHVGFFSISLVAGLPNDLAIYWQQYPWVMGEAMCKARSLVSEM